MTLHLAGLLLGGVDALLLQVPIESIALLQCDRIFLGSPLGFKKRIDTKPPDAIAPSTACGFITATRMPRTDMSQPSLFNEEILNWAEGSRTQPARTFEVDKKGPWLFAHRI